MFVLQGEKTVCLLCYDAVVKKYNLRQSYLNSLIVDRWSNVGFLT